MWKRQGSDKCFDEKHLRISWKINGFCNYKCSYCFDKNNNKLTFPSKKDISTLLKNVFSLKYNSFEFVLLGGEPTFYPYLIYLLNNILKNEKVNRIVIVTNGSNLDKIKEICNINNEKIHLSFSIHPESVELDNIYSIIDTINEYKNNCYFSLMYLPKYKNKLIEINNILKDKYISEFMLLRKPPLFNSLISYTIDDINFLSTHFNDDQYKDNYDIKWISNKNEYYEFQNHGFLMLNSNKYLNFKDFYCISNSTSMSIDNKGYFRGLICDESKKSNFSLFNEISNLEYIPTIIKCNQNNCLCMGNKHVLKFGSKEEAEEKLLQW